MDLDRPAGLVRSSPAAVLTAAHLHQKKRIKNRSHLLYSPKKPGDDQGSRLAHHFPPLKKNHYLDCKV